MRRDVNRGRRHRRRTRPSSQVFSEWSLRLYGGNCWQTDCEQPV